MEQLGMPAGPVRPPLENVREQDMPELRKIVELYRELGRPRESVGS